MKKGQAAMEFLMTYGWAILVVLAAIGALAYFGVLSPGNLFFEKTIFKVPFMNTESAVITLSGTNLVIQIPMTNSMGSSVTIDETSSSASGDGDCTAVSKITARNDDDSNSIANGDSFIVTWNCSNGNSLQAGDKFKANLGFSYTTSSGLVRKHSGEVVGKVQE